jgi:hypothetical protein
MMKSVIDCTLRLPMIMLMSVLPIIQEEKKERKHILDRERNERARRRAKAKDEYHFDKRKASHIQPVPEKRRKPMPDLPLPTAKRQRKP